MTQPHSDDATRVEAKQAAFRSAVSIVEACPREQRADSFWLGNETFTRAELIHADDPRV